jgi:hypothetical protein
LDFGTRLPHRFTGRDCHIGLRDKKVPKHFVRDSGYNAFIENITWREKFRYWFDNVMAREPLATIALLFLASLGFITVIGVLVTALGFAPEDADGKPQGLADVVWGNLTAFLESIVTVFVCNFFKKRCPVRPRTPPHAARG